MLGTLGLGSLSSLSSAFTHLSLAIFISFSLFFSSLVHTKEITVAAGWSRPPYIMSESQTGFEIDLVREVLRRLNYKVNIVSFAHNDTIKLLREGKVDIALTLSAKSSIDLAQLSDVYVVYQNVAISLKSKKLQIPQLEKLNELVVVGFQSASDVLGPDFKQAVITNPLYTEMADQKSQVELLFQDQVDVIILDLNVFNYLAAELNQANVLNTVDIHPLFALNRYSAGFKDLALKNAFNLELGRFVTSGNYDNLLTRYNYHIIAPNKAP